VRVSHRYEVCRMGTGRVRPIKSGCLGKPVDYATCAVKRHRFACINVCARAHAHEQQGPNNVAPLRQRPRPVQDMDVLQGAFLEASIASDGDLVCEREEEHWRIQTVPSLSSVQRCEPAAISPPDSDLCNHQDHLGCFDCCAAHQIVISLSTSMTSTTVGTAKIRVYL
jgi:hypothetical protein